jgi:aspartyl aminopeptidase
MSDFAEHQQFAEDFVTYLNEAVTAFHAAEASKLRLKAAGFEQLSEKDHWALQPGGKYFFARNDTAVIAFTVGKSYSPRTGSFTVLGAHTDSPCLRVKPVACVKKGENALMINTQPYGGGLWHTWFDRDLGLAGRAVFSDADGALQTRLFRIDSPIARIPNLSIHLTAGAERDGFSPNLHEHGKALLSMKPEFINAQPTAGEAEVAKRIHPALLRMVAAELQIDSTQIEDLEMQLIDVQPSTLGGASREFLYSGRLDNLCSSYQCKFSPFHCMMIAATIGSTTGLSTTAQASAISCTTDGHSNIFSSFSLSTAYDQV